MPSAQVNNVPYDFASTEVDADDQIIQGLRSISWEHGMDGEKMFGAGREELDETDGVYQAEDIEITMYVSDWYRPIAKLGPGYMRRAKTFSLGLTYGKDGDPTHSVTFERARIKKAAHDYSQGPSGLECSVTLSCKKVIEDGIDPVVLR